LKIFDVVFQPKNLRDLKKVQPSVEGTILIDEDALVKISNGDQMIYKKIPANCLSLAWDLANSVKTRKSFRTQGATTQSSIFGVLPRNALRSNFCRFSSDMKKHKQEISKAKSLTESIFEIYKSLMPKEASDFESIINTSIHPDWRWNKSPFLTLNLNINFGISFHKDAGNFDDFSNVLILAKHIEGGELVFPELGIALSQKNGFLAIFNGKKYIHGVAPIKPLSSQAKRVSIVAYSMALCKNCLSQKEELKRIQHWIEEKNKKKWDIKKEKIKSEG
jgi:hypothetical protein